MRMRVTEVLWKRDRAWEGGKSWGWARERISENEKGRKSERNSEWIRKRGNSAGNSLLARTVESQLIWSLCRILPRALRTSHHHYFIFGVAQWAGFLLKWKQNVRRKYGSGLLALLTDKLMEPHSEVGSSLAHREISLSCGTQVSFRFPISVCYFTLFRSLKFLENTHAKFI
jgi:hypothetical protein